MLTLSSISCSRAGRQLFRNLGYTIGDNSVVVIRGENGCGKTTLLETIACLRRPESGAVLYANKDVRGENYQEYCDIISYIGHLGAVKQQLTVKENLEFWAKLKNNSQAIPAALAFFGLEEYQNSLCSSLSAGYQKRVALARLMVRNSEIWLLDEPFTNLDDEGKDALCTLIVSRCERGGSVVLTAHGDVPFSEYAEINLMEFR